MVRDWFVRWVGRPWLDWCCALALSGCHLTVVLLTGQGDVLAWPDRDQRIDIYTAIATVAALVGSFVTAAIAHYAAAAGPRMRQMRTHAVQGPQFRRNWRGILGATLAVAGLCLLAMVLDTTESDPGGVHWLAEFAICLGAVRALRLHWLFGRVIVAADLDLERPE